MRKSAASFLAVCAALFLSACGPEINDETYDQIVAGLTVDQVNNLIGSEGEKEVAGGVQISAAGVMSTTNSEHLSEQVYVWKEAGLNKPQIVVKFKDGLMVSKSKNF
ncbi:MAG: hypothetical protein IT437_13760 [Phycisphaerales bacterium]|nr:hypothetical protein [Phycisphaerales bacterium]